MAVSHKTAWKFLPVKASGTALIIVKLLEATKNIQLECPLKLLKVYNGKHTGMASRSSACISSVSHDTLLP